MAAQKQTIIASTQKHLPIEDILDDLVLLADGSCCLILETTAINFGLLSEKEQDATIYAYAALLNSLSFPLQILIASQRKDISSYLDLLERQMRVTRDKTYRDKIKEYKVFVEKTVKTKKVLDKKFYLVIPFSSLELGVPQAIGGLLKKGQGLFDKDYIIRKAQTSLFPKRDHLIRQLNRLGLRARQLTTEELISLFYHLYNPGVEGQKLAPKSDYQVPIVSPARSESWKARESSSEEGASSHSEAKRASFAEATEGKGK